MNNNYNENYIDDNELEKKEITQSFSISTGDLKKQEIIKKIEPTEKLFWKLFRNKVIYKKIFSFMDKQFSFDYDSISSIKDLINSNQYSILKEKVYRNCRYLQFDSHQFSSSCTLDEDNLVKLFSTINHDDYRFYRNFFNIENDYYYSSQDVVAYALIEAKKLEIFKLFVNEFNYVPKKTDLLHSIINGSNKFIKYLVVELNSVNSFLLLDKNYSEVSNDFKYFYSRGSCDINQENNFFKGLLCYLNNIAHDHNYDRNQYYQLLINCTKGEYSKFYHINDKSTLKTLITTAILILKLRISPKEEEEKPIVTIEEIDNFIKKVNKVNLKSLLYDPINFNNDNDEIKNFIKKLLKLNHSIFGHEISNFLYFCYYHEESNDDHYKTIIYPSCDLLEIAVRFGIYEILESYETNKYKQGFQILLPNIIQFNKGKTTDKEFKILFSHCFNKEKKINFIDEIVKRIIKQPDLEYQSCCCYYFLCMLVIHNDTELVKYYSNKVGNHLQITLDKLLLPPTYYIESIEMLEFLFYNQSNYFKDIVYDNYISTFYKNLELLKHFESLFYESKSVNLLSCSGIHVYNGLISFIVYGYFGDRINYLEFKRNKNYADFVHHFDLNPKLYHNDKLCFEWLFHSFSTSELSYKLSIRYETLRDLVINSNIFVKQPMDQIVHIVQSSYSKEFFKFIDWVYTNYNDELKNGDDLFSLNPEIYQYHLLIAIDRFDFNNNNNSSVNKYYNGNEEDYDVYIKRLSLLLKDVNQFTPYLYEINNFKLLNWFLTIIEKYHSDSSLSGGTLQDRRFLIKIFVNSFMEYITKNSKLQIFEYIHQNFNFILKEKSDGGIFSNKELKSFLLFSLQRGAIKISKFLFQFITITKEEFEKYSNEKSIKYKFNL
ncbi:hypothetical protein ACTFIR_012149 [Dictyostelium discoideum]